MFSELNLFERSVCCCFSSSCCYVSFVSAPTKFSGSDDLTSLNASLGHSSLGQSSKNTICLLATIHRSCSVTASFWSNSFLLMKFGKAFVKIFFILLFLSFTGLFRVTWFAAWAAATLSISPWSPGGFADGIGVNTGLGWACVAFIWTCTGNSSGLPVL